MHPLPNHEYIRLGANSNIIPLKMPKGDSVYRDLNKILGEEFPGASAGHLRESHSKEREVILFPNEEDCTAFLLRYGHIYGEHK